MPYRSNMIRVAVAASLVALCTVGPALVQGYYANRWGAPADLGAAADQLRNFPKAFGEWVYVTDRDPLPPSVCEELGLAGYISRDYQNRQTGATVTCLLMVGQPGKLLRHEPDICYANRNNKQEGAPLTTKVAAQSADEFRTLRYTAPSAVEERFTVTYGMRTDDSTWDVPYWRRLEFAGGTHLFKIQVLTVAPSGNFDTATNTNKKFLTDFVAAFDRWLYGRQAAPDPSPAAPVAAKVN